MLALNLLWNSSRAIARKYIPFDNDCDTNCIFPFSCYVFTILYYTISPYSGFFGVVFRGFNGKLLLPVTEWKYVLFCQHICEPILRSLRLSKVELCCQIRTKTAWTYTPSTFGSALSPRRHYPCHTGQEDARHWSTLGNRSLTASRSHKSRLCFIPTPHQTLIFFLYKLPVSQSLSPSWSWPWNAYAIHAHQRWAKQTEIHE